MDFETQRRLPRLALFFLLGHVLAGPAAAQEPVPIAERPACEECRLHATRARTLGDVNGPGIVGEPNSVVRNSRGWYFVSHLTGWNSFSVFDENGQFLRRVGRSGQGPGEFGFVRMLRVGPLDSVFAVDNSLRRVTRYSPELEFSGNSPFPGEPFDVEVLSGGRMLVNMDLRTKDLAGVPLHFLSTEGEVTKSFGSDPPAYRRDMPGLTRRSITLRPDGSFWTAGFSEYSIDLWRADGSLQQRWVREVDWFERHAGRMGVRQGEAPKPIIVDIKEDARGLLWVMIWVADADWKSAVGSRGSVQGQQRASLTSADAYLDTLIEIIDRKQNRLLLSQRLPQAMHSFVGRDEAVSYRETENGAFIDVWILSLEDLHGALLFEGLRAGGGARAAESRLGSGQRRTASPSIEGLLRSHHSASATR